MIYAIHRYFLHITIVISTILSSMGCMDSRVISPDELPGSQLRGSVRLLSEDNSFAINKNLVLVKLEGTGFETFTDYTILYSKPGYSNVKRFSVRSDGAMPVIVNPITLVQVPPFTVDSISLMIQSDSLEVFCRINQISDVQRRIILYIDSNAIDGSQRNRYVFTDIGLIIEPGNSIGSIRIPLSRFYNSGFVSGRNVYCAGFPILRFEATADESYFAIDPITKKTIFWNVNPNGANAQFTLP
jgi:hypothetical protein